MRLRVVALLVPLALSVLSGPPPAHSQQAAKAPRTVVAPSLPPLRWVPGYWIYQWTPQRHTYEVWVPGRWSADGTWLEAHYEPRTIETGYFQPVWVPGHWAVPPFGVLLRNPCE